MFERYTETARRVIFFARYEASQLGAHEIGTEHLLLGIVRECGDLVDRVFGKNKRDAIRKEIEDSVSKGEVVSTSVDMALTPRAKGVLTFASEEAQRFGDKQITPEHLLLGLGKEETGDAAAVFRNHDVTFDLLRKRLNLAERQADMFYCPNCARSRNDPLTCGDCSAVICRVCGTALESPDELGIG